MDFSQFLSEKLKQNKTVNQTDKDAAALLLLQDRSYDAEMETIHAVLITVCVAAILSNLIAIAAITGIKKRTHTSKKCLVLSLCCADLLTSVAFLARVILARIYAYHSVPGDQYGQAVCAYKIVQGFIFTGHCATLLNLLSLSIDHYCAIGRPLNYPITMAKERVRGILAVCWTLAFLLGFSDFLLPVGFEQANPHEGTEWLGGGNFSLPLVGKTQKPNVTMSFANFLKMKSLRKAKADFNVSESSIPSRGVTELSRSAGFDWSVWGDSPDHAPNYCEKIFHGPYDPDLAMFTLVFICLIVMGTLYALIVRVLRHQPNVHVRLTQSYKMNVRGLVTTFFIMAAFVLFWIPFCAFEIITVTMQNTMGREAYRSMGLNKRIIWYLYVLMIVNALLDPIIYAVRMREVHHNLKKMCCKVIGTKEEATATGLLLNRARHGHTRMSLSTSFKSSDI